MSDISERDDEISSLSNSEENGADLLSDSSDHEELIYEPSEQTVAHSKLMVKYNLKSSLDAVVQESLEDGENNNEKPEEQVKEGYLRIKKLDRNLRKIHKLESEAKKSRLRFEAQMAREIERLTDEYPDSANNNPIVMANTSKFMGIDLPATKKKKTSTVTDSLSADLLAIENCSSSEQENSDSDSDIVPVFATELPERKKVENEKFTSQHSLSSSSDYLTARSSASSGSPSRHPYQEGTSTPSQPTEQSVPTTSRVKEAFTAPSKKNVSSQRRKNFISRNMKVNLSFNNIPVTSFLLVGNGCC